MKLLFLTCYENDACTYCIQQLQMQLFKYGVQSDLLSFRWDLNLPLIELTQTGMRYRVDTWYRYAQVKRDENGQISMPWYGLFRVALIRALSMLVGGFYYKEQGLPFIAGKHLGKRLVRLCQENQYDWVVSTSYPFVIHKLVNKYRPVNCHWAMYMLDPFYNNMTYSKKRKDQRLRLEEEVSRNANLIFYVPEQKLDYERNELRSLRGKYRCLNYPNFKRPVPSLAVSPLRTKEDGIDLLYLGTLYSEIRKPDRLLELFSHMYTCCAKLRLHLVGSVFGVGAGETVLRYKQMLGDALQTYQPMSHEQANAALQSAHILISLGNTMQNQVPSKTWEYIAAAKPIIHICHRDDCNVIPYLQAYPLAYIIYKKQCSERKIIDDAVVFCIKNRGRVLSWEVICHLYDEYRVERVTEGFIKELQGA